MMRLALTGASGTGKTTLAKALVDDGLFSTFLGSSGRTLSYVVGGDAREFIKDQRSYHLYQMARVYAEMARLFRLRQSEFVLDRGPWDCIGYHDYSDEVELEISTVSKQSLTHVILVPTGVFDQVDDGVTFTRDIRNPTDTENDIVGFLTDLALRSHTVFSRLSLLKTV